MSYVKWTGNRIAGDGTTNLVLSDGTEISQGVPVNLKADLRKELEENYIFEESSKEEADEVAYSPDAQQPVGSDVAGTAPLFQNDNPTSQVEQTSETDQGGSSRSRS